VTTHPGVWRSIMWVRDTEAASRFSRG